MKKKKKKQLPLTVTKALAAGYKSLAFKEMFERKSETPDTKLLEGFMFLKT